MTIGPYVLPGSASKRILLNSSHAAARTRKPRSPPFAAAAVRLHLRLLLQRLLVATDLILPRHHERLASSSGSVHFPGASRMCAQPATRWSAICIMLSIGFIDTLQRGTNASFGSLPYITHVPAREATAVLVGGAARWYAEAYATSSSAAINRIIEVIGATRRPINCHLAVEVRLFETVVRNETTLATPSKSQMRVEVTGPTRACPFVRRAQRDRASPMNFTMRL